jgi:transcriptional regulator with XRE-family HTH domain
VNESQILKLFGKQLQAARNAKSWSQEKLAITAELDRTYVSSVERGHRNISIINVYKLANALGVTPESFFKEIDAPMSKIDEAYYFYKKHIHDEEKIKLLRDNDLKVSGSVSSVMWELFGAILTGKSGAGLTGADLQGWEVKSAKDMGSFEYQYHLNTGAEKLKEDSSVNHLFFTYSETYMDIDVRAIKGSALADQFFKKWEPEYHKNYDQNAPTNQRRQRFRKNIPYAHVEKNGVVIFRIRNGKIAERNDFALDLING